MFVGANNRVVAAIFFLVLSTSAWFGTAETTWAFQRFTDLIHFEGGDANAQHFLGGETRRVLVSPATVGPSLHPSNSDGTLTLNIEDDIPEIAETSTGIILKLQYYDGISSLFSSKRNKYVYLTREEIKKTPAGVFSCMASPRETLTLRPYGQPAEQVRVYARQALTHTLRLEAPPIIVPPAARLDFAVALQKEWRISPDAQAKFRIRLATQAGTEIIYEEVVRRHALGEAPRWRERSVALDAYADQKVQLTFETEGMCDDPLAFPLWAHPIIYSKRRALPTTPTNIILIALDTLRADHLGCYGYVRNTSPNIDRFAAESILFERAIASAPWTTPSFGSVFTGKHPSRHKAGRFTQGFVLASHFTTLAELISQRGLLTAAFTEGVAVRGPIGFSRGFDLYSDGESPESHLTGTAENTFRQAAAWLERYAHLPFFLFVHTYEPHAPYDAPEPWKLKFADPDYNGPPVMLGPDAVTEKEKQHIRDRYDGGIAYTDHWAGWFLDRLDGLGLRENTMVVLFSDHGEEFWEHGEVGHTSQIYDEVLWTPLIMRMPGNDYHAHRVSKQVALTDIFATVLDTLDISVSGVYDSYSLLPVMRNDQDVIYKRENVVSELANISSDSSNYVEFLMRSIRFPHVKYISGNKKWTLETRGSTDETPVLEEEFYDIVEDPGETKDLANKREKEVLILRGLLGDFLRRQGAIDDEEPSGELMDLMHEDDIQALRALGYL